jgi:hypothetical protein
MKQKTSNMENLAPKDHHEDPNKPVHDIETNYKKHEQDPGPAPTVKEKDENGAGLAMKWIIPIAVIVLIILWFIFFRDSVTE